MIFMLKNQQHLSRHIKCIISRIHEVETIAQINFQLLDF